MTPHEAALLVNGQFEYTTDREQYRFRDVWKVMSPKNMAGDCEDYALTVLYHLAGESKARMARWLITGKAKIHFHKHEERGTGHVSLEFNGRHIDNNTRYWGDGRVLAERGYRRVFWVPFPIVGLKILFGMLVSVFRK